MFDKSALILRCCWRISAVICDVVIRDSLLTLLLHLA